MWRLSFLAVIWTIWKERNSRCFEGIAVSESRLVEKTKLLVALWVFILPSFKGYSLDQIVFHWKGGLFYDRALVCSVVLLCFQYYSLVLLAPFNESNH